MYGLPPRPPAYAPWHPHPHGQPWPVARGRHVAPVPCALYVLGSFALMMALAAVLAVAGSVVTIAILDEDPDAEPVAAESASLARP